MIEKIDEENNNSAPRALLANFREFFLNLVDLKKGLDREGTIVYIKNNKKMVGANVWLLMCSIMIASLGLDKESPAIIIGAMLISPLMAPILGIGLGIAINDRKTLIIALRNFGIAIIVALLTSWVYFSLTPLGEFNGEMESRIKPDFLDGLVAIFGGLAGIISVTRKDKSSAIPGVAIATALMPPLCVCGYGLANANTPIILGSFYLFFLNSFFIALTAYVMVRLMKFDIVAYQDKADKRKTNFFIAFFSLLIIISSLYLLFKVYEENQFEVTAKQFVESHFEPFEVLSYTSSLADSSLIVKLLDRGKTESEVAKLKEELQNIRYHFNTSLHVIQVKIPELEEMKMLKTKITGIDAIQRRIDEILNDKQQVQDSVALLETRLDQIVPDSALVVQLIKEIQVFAPEVTRLSLGSIRQNGVADLTAMCILGYDDQVKTKKKTELDIQIATFLKTRLKLENIIINQSSD